MRPATLPCILLCVFFLAMPVSGAGIPAGAKAGVTQVTSTINPALTYVAITKITTTTGAYSPGSIVIQSYPQGAEIWKDGSDLHQVTPGTIPVPAGAVLPASYRIVLKYPGYQDYSTTVVPVAGETRTVSAKLVALPTVTATVTAALSPTTPPVTGTSRVTVVRSTVTTVTQAPETSRISTSPAVTTVQAGSVQQPAATRTPRRVPGFGAFPAALVLGVVLLLKRSR